MPGEPGVTAALGASYEAVHAGQSWGRPWGTTWFRLTGTVPAGWAGRTVEALVNLGFGTETRTACNVTTLMDGDPGFVFAMSQPQQLAWLKQHQPGVYARVKDKVAGGQFVPVGGMWVEADTNLPGAEALARQFVYGKRFLLDGFGIEAREVWLPDSFGYTAALLARQATIEPTSAAWAAERPDGGFVLDNGLVRVTVDPRGLVTSVYDVPADREAVPAGRVANLLQTHLAQPVGCLGHRRVLPRHRA